MLVYIDGEEATELDSSKNYTLDTEQSTCTYKDGSIIDNLSLSYDSETGELQISPFTTKGTKCTLYFNEGILLKDAILANAKRGEGTPNFSNTSCTNANDGSNCEEQTVGLYEEQTSLGTTYYFRGDVEDNYLIFADKYWRIIRVNEDGSVRIIYNGEKSEVDALGRETVLANGYYSGDFTQIESSTFNNLSDKSYYVGFTYTINNQRPSNPNTGESSTIKEILDSWYISSLQQYDSKIVSAPGFCNDRNTRSGDNWVTSETDFYYAAYERTNGNPTFECSNSNDLYITKIGLISADEVIYAGGTDNNSNYGYYLYTGDYYWTISPSYFDGYYAYMFSVDYDGYLFNDYIDNTYGVRPVINLSADIPLISGNGTISTPYKV